MIYEIHAPGKVYTESSRTAACKLARDICSAGEIGGYVTVYLGDQCIRAYQRAGGKRSRAVVAW